MDFPDLSKIGAPNWLSVFFAGIFLGGFLVFGLYENFRLPGLELSLQEAHQKTEIIEKAYLSWKKHAEELDVQVSELNKEYKSQNDQLANQRLPGWFPARRHFEGSRGMFQHLGGRHFPPKTR